MSGCVHLAWCQIEHFADLADQIAAVTPTAGMQTGHSSDNIGGVIRPRPVFIVVSGPPGSGKTTLANGIAQEMGLPLIAKDVIKEALMSVLAVPDVDASKAIGRAAVEVMFAVAATASGGAVLESNFHHSISRTDIEALPGRIVEVFCRCDREVALSRYRERSEHRHPGHFDERRTDEELWNDEVTAPIGGTWVVLEVKTDAPVVISTVVRSIEGQMG